MDLQRAVKRKLIRKRDVRGVIEIAANAIFEVNRMRGARCKTSQLDPVEQLRRWCERRDMTIGPKVFASIVKKWRTAEYLMNVEDCGDLLSLTPEQRVRNKLWSLGARHETAQQRRHRKEQRQADARARKKLADRDRVAAKRRANGARTRAEYEALSVSEFCRKHNINRSSYERAAKEGRIEAFLRKRGITDECPAKVERSVAAENNTYSATHFSTFSAHPGGRPRGRSANFAAIAILIDRAASMLATKVAS